MSVCGKAMTSHFLRAHGPPIRSHTVEIPRERERERAHNMTSPLLRKSFSWRGNSGACALGIIVTQRISVCSSWQTLSTENVEVIKLTGADLGHLVCTCEPGGEVWVRISRARSCGTGKCNIDFWIFIQGQFYGICLLHFAQLKFNKKIRGQTKI